MGIWDRLSFTGKTISIWEAGTRAGKTKDQIATDAAFNSGAVKKWEFKNKNQRRFGRGFYAAINRMGESSYKKKILNLIENRVKRGFLSEKQWKYLGLLMRKADPACLDNPKIKTAALPLSKTDFEKYSGLRKKSL